MVKFNQKGNKLFNRGDFGGAVKKYSEAIEKEGSQWFHYRNRAKAYSALEDYDSVLLDCNECLALNPECLEALLLQAKAHQGMGQTPKAKSAYEKALKIDSNCSEAIEGLKNCVVQSNSGPKSGTKRKNESDSDDEDEDSDEDDEDSDEHDMDVREEKRKEKKTKFREAGTLEDPEVQKILKNPALKKVLQLVQNNPQAIQDHLNDPNAGGKKKKQQNSELSDEEDEVIEHEGNILLHDHRAGGYSF